MKKIIVFFAAILLFTSCTKDYEATITYRIYYPGNTVTKTRTMPSKEQPGYILGSDRGSNYLYLCSSLGPFARQEKLEDTSAPIEVVSLTARKK